MRTFIWMVKLIGTGIAPGIILALLITDVEKSSLIWFFFAGLLLIWVASKLDIRQYGHAYMGGFDGAPLIGVGVVSLFIGTGVITTEYLRENEFWFYVLGTCLMVAGLLLIFFMVREPIFKSRNL